MRTKKEQESTKTSSIGISTTLDRLAHIVNHTSPRRALPSQLLGTSTTRVVVDARITGGRVWPKGPQWICCIPWVTVGAQQEGKGCLEFCWYVDGRNGDSAIHLALRLHSISQCISG